MFVFSLNIPPGTKLKIMANVMARNGFLLLTPAVVKVLGGHVDHMVEKWKASKVSNSPLELQQLNDNTLLKRQLWLRGVK